jgi:hypothetical protein
MKNNKFRCYQAYLSQEQEVRLDPGFIPLLTKGVSDPDLREFGLYRRLFCQGAHRNSDYFGIFSHKFKLKTSLCADDVYAFIESNPGYDVYLFNPYPQNADYSYNLWQQGEIAHPGLIGLADELFEAAKIPYRASTAPRMARDVLLCCNFWVGTRAFCERFFELVESIWGALATMPSEKRDRFFQRTEYIVSDCCYFPFIFERLISTWLANDLSILKMPYLYDSNVELNRCLHLFEKQLLIEMKPKVAEWDASNGWTEERQAWMYTVCKLNKVYYDLFYSANPPPF